MNTNYEIMIIKYNFLYNHVHRNGWNCQKLAFFGQIIKNEVALGIAKERSFKAMLKPDIFFREDFLQIRGTL